MKKLIFLVICTYCSYLYREDVMAWMGMGKVAYGIDQKNPLGTASRMHRTIIRAGLQGELGEEGKPRTIEFSDAYSEKVYKGFGSHVYMKIGKDERVKKITFVFLSTQRGMSPQRMTMTETFARDFWKLLGNDKTKFERIQGTLEFPYGIRIADWAMKATFDTGKVQGQWAYHPGGNPYEVMEIHL